MRWVCATWGLTYLSPWLLLEHRPCTTSLQRLLSWAILSSCFQFSPVCVMSASRSRRQVFFGLPLFRLPWGFHAEACLVMLVFGFLNVWPIHLHLLIRMHTCQPGENVSRDKWRPAERSEVDFARGIRGPPPEIFKKICIASGAI